PDRYDKVNTNYEKIWDALANKNLTFMCDCDDKSAYAYVVPVKPYEIHLCQLFWKAPLTGTDSQGGVILHEMSHFYVVASTNDHFYGQPRCRDLAKNDPDSAIDNADSHEYFAENHPKLSM
ncbi:MAG: M35 family metallo-endopeptidase, partial [Deltaproteobacteria bacterium]|nr:M35 family metallo-endopeptidase [Deltaproteobacteria bacterium]